MSRMISRTAAYSGRIRTGCMALFLPSRRLSFHARSASTAKVTRPVQALQEGLLAFSSAAHDAEKAKIFNAMINMALVNEEAQEAKWEAKETAWGWERKSLALRLEMSETAVLRIKNSFNARGALERAALSWWAARDPAYQRPPGIQTLLDHIMKESDVAAIAAQRAAGSRACTARSIMRAGTTLYHQLSKTAHGNDHQNLVIRVGDTYFTEDEGQIWMSIMEFLKRQQYTALNFRLLYDSDTPDA